MTLMEVFDLCEELELRHAKLYAKISLQLGWIDERIAKFWERMSMEEWQHYIIVNFGRSLCERTFGFGLDFPAENCPALSIQETRLMLTQYEQMVDSGDISIDDGFNIAIELESNEADEPYLYLISVVKNAVSESGKNYLMERISRIDREMKTHIEKLIHGTQKFSKNPEIIRKAHLLKS